MALFTSPDHPEIICPTCQEVLPFKAKFCLNCGRDVSPAHTAVAVPADFAVPTSYADLEVGERRQATVLFSDLTGYTAMNEHLDPEAVEAIMRRIKNHAVRIVESHEGIVNQFVGDEVLALFGICAAHEDDPLRAVRAALELHAVVRAMSPEVDGRIGQPLRMHTGIHTGLIVTNSRDTRDGLYGITGETVITGVRLKTEAQPNEILVSPQTYRLIAPYFDTETLPAVRVKGKAEPITPCRVLRPLPVRSRLEASEKRGFTRYTGRQDELAVLQGCLQRTIRGEGQFVTVMGEAGVGKSRLLHEFISGLDRAHVSVLQGTCHAHGSTTSYLPFLDTLRRELNVVEGQSREEVLETAVATMAGLRPSLTAYLPFYLHLLSIRTDPMIAHMQGPELRLAMQEALTRLIMAKAERQPTLLLLEDWHWHDEASEAVIQHLLTLMARHSLLVGITYRSECAIDWSDPPHYTPMRVHPLDSSHTEDIAKSVWKAAAIPSELKTLLYERTGGNPLFIEEACHALSEEGAVLVKDGRAVLTRSLKEIALPHTVQAIIRSRLDRLSVDLKEALHLASVIGRVFEQRILERLYQGRTALADVIAALRSIEMISTVGDAPRAEYLFKHILTQEVTYDTLLLTRRRKLHLLVGHTIEELCEDRMTEQVNVLYRHFRLAEDWLKSVQYGRLAAEKAQKLSQFEEAVRLLEEVEQCLLRLPDEAEREEMRLDCFLQQERLYDTLGWRERQHGVIERMLSLLKEKEQPARLAAVRVRQGDLYTQLGRFDEAGAALEEAITLRQQLRDQAGESHALRSLSFLRWHQGRNEEAVACNEAALDMDRARGDRKAISHDLTNLAAVLQNHGDHDGALVHLQEALELEQVERDPFNRMTILYNMANVHSRSRAFERALAYYHESLQVCVAHRLLINQTLVLSCIASIRWQQGKTGECLQLYQEAVDVSRSMKYAQGLSNGLRAMGDLLLVLERPQEALSCIVESIAVCAELGDLKNQAVSLSIAAMLYERVNKDYGKAVGMWSDVRTLKKHLADLDGELDALQQMGRVVRLQRSEPSEALPYLLDALELADRLGDRQTQGRLLNTIGILEWGRGAYGSASRRYEQALKLYRELGDSVKAGTILNSLGVTLRCLGQYEDALAHLREAVTLTHQTQQFLAEGHGLAAIGDVYAAMEQYEPARAHYRDSLAIRRRLQDRTGEGWMLHHIAKTYATEKTMCQAQQYLRQASHIGAECHDTELLAACAEVRGRLQANA